jgi:hypothetical protein
MSAQTSDVGWGFWIRWVVATIIGWVVGMFAAIILSSLVVNLVYPRETDLIVGLCLGAAVSLSQKIAVRRRITLARSWVWGAMVGIGIPFVVVVLLDELRPGAGKSWWLLLLIVGGAICGLLQVPALRPHTSRVYWWVLASTVSWSLAWFISRVAGVAGFLGGGAVLGAFSCGVLLWLWKPQKAATTV